MRMTPDPMTAPQLARAPLGMAVAVLLAAMAVPQSAQAQFQDVAPGQTLVVEAGSPLEGAHFTVRGGTLILRGSYMSTFEVTYSAANQQGGQLILQGARVAGPPRSLGGNVLRNSSAVITDSFIQDRVTLSTVVNAQDNPRSQVIAVRSTFNGNANISFAANTGGTLDADASTFLNMIRNGGSIIRLRNGTQVTGETNGIDVRYSSDARLANNQADWGMLIDNSRVSGTAGAAIAVAGFADEAVRLTVQNRATLTGGNGAMVDAQANALLDFTGRTSTLNGDFLVADSATATLRFLDGLNLTGRVLGPADIIVDQGGRWTLSGDSNTGNLTLGAGSDIFLGAAGQAAYPQLTVNGNYTGQGGTLHFNTVLAGDDAASSSMIVSGDTSGSTNVSVSNINGAGAQTVNGIRLVQVGGASNGTFALQGRAVGGMYEYFLRKGTPTAANGNWYLTSAYTGDPCDINPALPQCPVDPVDPVNPVDPIDPIVDPIPVLRPESGAYLANQAAAQQMFTLRRHDRGEPGFDRASPGTWVRVGRDQLQASIAGQVDARTHINTVQLGSDLWRWGEGRGQLGVMLGTGDATTQAVSSLSGYGTRGKVKGKSAGVYAGWVQDAQSSAGAYVDGWVQAGRFDNDVQGEGLEREQYDSRTRSASLEAGYAFTLRSSASSTLYLQPQAQVTWSDYDGDRHVEANGTTVEDGRSGGVNSRVGMRLFGQSTRVGNRVQPFLGVNWLRGERDPSLRFNAEQLHAKLPQNRYEAQAGAQLQLGQRWTAWGDLRVQRGDGGYRDNGAQMGLRAAW